MVTPALPSNPPQLLLLDLDSVEVGQLAGHQGVVGDPRQGEVAQVSMY